MKAIEMDNFTFASLGLQLFHNVLLDSGSVVFECAFELNRRRRRRRGREPSARCARREYLRRAGQHARAPRR